MKLNEVFEFVGVLTLDSEFQVDKDEYDEFSNGFSEDALVHFPPNKVLTLACRFQDFVVLNIEHRYLTLFLLCTCCWHNNFLLCMLAFQGQLMASLFVITSIKSSTITMKIIRMISQVVKTYFHFYFGFVNFVGYILSM